MEGPRDGHAALERLLGHQVDVVLPPATPGGARVAVSRTAAPVCIRSAWVNAEGRVVARVGCPPGVPSAVRPLTATICDVSAEGVSDRVVLGLAAPGVAAARIVGASGEGATVPVHRAGVVAGRLSRGASVSALDALASSGESIGRLTRAGIHDLALVAGRIEGRLGATHGLAAGFGTGETVDGLPIAEMEAGYEARLPEWLPAGFTLATVRVEPEVAYPFAPPSIALAWLTASAGSRVLLRQCPGPLAVPELPDARGRALDVNGATGVLRARGMAFLVWESDDRAFGLQVWGTDDPSADALRIARSVPAGAPPIP